MTNERTALVIGATGGIGGEMARTLAARGWTVRGLHREHGRLVARPPALLEHRSFVAYWCARTATNGAYQMQAVAGGWPIYELTGSAFDLGLVGLILFFPVVGVGFLIGHIPHC